MSAGPKVVCAGCGIEIPIGYPVCPDCFGAIEPKSQRYQLIGATESPRALQPRTSDNTQQ